MQEVRVYTAAAPADRVVTRPQTIVMLAPAFPATEQDSCWLPPLQTFVKALAHRNPDLRIHVLAFQYPYKHCSYTWHGVQVHALAGRNRPFPLRLGTWLRA